jgi:NAD(P)H-hydrate repair Nnr-like enzyme with NAD(P)H-hydrate dehydratase domain
VPSSVALVVDAAALLVLSDEPSLFSARSGDTVLTPNGDELATMLGLSAAPSRTDLEGVVTDAVRRFGAVVAAEGRIAGPGSDLFVDETGDVGLATSGSGDVLAGAVAGLCARGADALTAAVVGVHLHGVAGGRMARAKGDIGYLARELLDELPLALADLPG